MKGENPNPFTTLRFVLAFLAVKVVVVSGGALYTVATGDQPSIPATLVTLVAVGMAIFWYSKAVNRPMTGSQIFTFSVGNTLADFVLTIVWIGAWMWHLGIPFNWAGFGVALGVQLNSHDAVVAFWIGFIFGELQVFFWSALFAWLISRKLPIAAWSAE